MSGHNGLAAKPQWPQVKISHCLQGVVQHNKSMDSKWKSMEVFTKRNIFDLELRWTPNHSALNQTNNIAHSSAVSAPPL